MNIDNFSKLYSIFTSKDWHSKKEYNNNVFENLCKLLSNLNDNQQSLILELVERYVWLSINEYNSSLVRLFNSISKEDIEGISKCFLFPVVRTGEEDKTKSGHGILFMLRGIKPFLDNFTNKSFCEIEKYSFFKENFEIQQDEIIFLLDDFLGSGSTIESTIKELMSYGIPCQKIRVVAIAAHNQSLAYLNSVNIKYYIEILMPKGITDYYTNDVLSEKIEIMNQIEKLLPTKKYNFGYAKSEALITLYRTPNNTFPIFWLDHKKDNISFKAPFPRF